MIPLLDPPDRHHLDAASGWLELGNATEARHEFDQIAAALADHPAVLDFEWHLLAQERQWEAAVDRAARLIAILPDCASAWIHRSYALHELRRTREAYDLLLPTVRKFSDEVTIPYNLACYTCQLGELAAARDWLERAWSHARNRTERSLQLRTALADGDLQPLWPEIRQQLSVIETK